MDYKHTYSLLQQHGQTHLLKFYDSLDQAEKNRLLGQIEKVDWSLLSLETEDSIIPRGSFSPLGALEADEIEQKRPEFEELGIKALKQGKIGAVLLAGGQGSRLGFDKPKGAYNIGVTRELYIFECLIHNMLDTVKAAGAWFPLAIMTSEINYTDTVDFFEEHDYFGYRRDLVSFFRQEMAPAVDINGKIMLQDKGCLALSPNGNGGWFSSLDKAGILAKLKASGVEWLSIFAVDNVLQRVNDPAFIGATLSSGCQCGAKVIRKNAPDERIGVMCLEDGKPSIVEYYETSKEMQEKRNAKGGYAYSFGVILNYLFKITALESADISALPYHIVKKKIPCIDENGNRVTPESPNGYKFERLAVDIIHRLDSCIPYEIIRSREFAPIKNSVGTDSVESARALLELNGVTL